MVEQEMVTEAAAVQVGERVLEVTDLSIQFKSEHGWSTVVDHLDLTLERGETLGLVGESGSGKTTVGLAVLGHARRGVAIDHGSVSCGGIEVLALDDEGKRNFGEVTESAASKSVELLKSISSTGYLRKRLPQELVVFQGGAATAFQTNSDAAAFTAVVAESTTALTTGTVSMDARTKAKMQGYEGDPCGECGNYTLVRNGTCMKCNTCGGTSGCS